MIRPMLLTVLVASSVALAEPPATTPAPAPAKPTTTTPSKVTPGKKDTTTKPAAETKTATLEVGSKAPAINVANWVKGSEVKSFAAGKVYVVEFWATWCPPCKASIPHLTELAKKHPEATVIGVSVWEEKTKAPKDKLLKGVEDFVKSKGDEMSYTVGFDAEKFMEKNWLAAAGKNSIPTAFIIGGDGKIAYIGHPMKPEFETAFEAALAAAAATPTSSTPDASKPSAAKPGTTTPEAKPTKKG
jgi:thiol-disulfide isomerase/thioredoxin